MKVYIYACNLCDDIGQINQAFYEIDDYEKIIHVCEAHNQTLREILGELHILDMRGSIEVGRFYFMNEYKRRK